MENLTNVNISKTLLHNDSDSFSWIDWEIYGSFEKLINLGLNPVLVICGIVGNVMALLILTRYKQKSSTTVLLICLAFWDLVFILMMAIVLFLLNTSMFNPRFGAELRMMFIIPFNVYVQPLAGRIENWVTAIISLERVVAVLFPLKVKFICTKKAMIGVLVATMLSIAVVTIPKLYIYERKTVILPDGNSTTFVTLGSFGKMKKEFEAYYISSEILLRFLPMTTVIICNFIIVSALCYRKRWRKEMTGNRGKEEELQITITLLTVTFLFVLCLLPATISRIMVVVENKSYFTNTDGISQILLLVGSFTETLNSSINVFVYLVFSKNFRGDFRKLCCSSCFGHLNSRKNYECSTSVYRISDSV